MLTFMHPQPSLMSRRENNRTSKPAFAVVTIHDGFSADMRAKEALEWLKQTLGSDLQIHTISWSFEQLERPDLRAMSIRAAADMLIVSASDLKPLPEHITQWLRSSLAEQRETRPVLVALHDEKMGFDRTQGPLCTHLKRVAATWQTEFMCNEDFDQRLDLGFATQLIRHKSQGSFHRKEPFGREFCSAPRFWGING